MKYLHVLTLFLLASTSLFSQTFSRQDSLRGSITPQRAWWEVGHYDLSVEVLPELKTIIGTNVISYTVLEEGTRELQIDLQEPMEITSVMQEGNTLDVRSEGSAHFITLKTNQIKGAVKQLAIGFEGIPRQAKNAPWDGGWVWKKDTNGQHQIATANQGIGASVWWPNRDHPEDEVDSLNMHVTVPKDLIDVSNGRLTGIDSTNTTKTFHWEVRNPINNYGININIGDYVRFNEVVDGEKGKLDMDYWVLREDLEKAKEHFKQAPMMIKAFEHWFGPYPFYEDSFKLVQVPYLGMEHQSSVTYGNQFKNGYLGRDLSGTGWGLKFDFIIIHEAGHEWFANNITNKDAADMWIHEGFTAYSEGLFLDYHYGKEAARDYVIGTRRSVQNDSPIIGKYHVNNRGSGDMYYKGANILHMIRTLANDDALWRETLRGLNKDFYHQTVTTQTVEDYISRKLNLDLKAFFNQYLRGTKIPTLDYKLEKGKLSYRYANVVSNFAMPLDVEINGEQKRIIPTTTWQTEKVGRKVKSIEVAEDYYVNVRKK